MIFVNLPVRDVAAARAFWNALGYPTNEQFCDAHTANAALADNIVLMLLDHERFADFVTGPIADPKAATGVLNALSADSREAVDALADKAVAAGASTWLPPQDHGFMYGRSFQDPDGHVWEVLWMDPAAVAGSADADADADQALVAAGA
jgi:hypothetical protein